MLQHRLEGVSHLRNGKVGMWPGDDRMTGTGEQVERSGARSQWNGLNTRICSSPRDGAEENEVWLRRHSPSGCPWSRDGG